MNYKKLDDFYIIRLEKGEELIKNLLNFCEEEKVFSGFFFGLGAASKVKLSAYNLETKSYKSEVFDEPLEITSLVGNIAILENEVKLHCHGVFGKDNFQTISGHLDQLVTSATVEIFLKPLSKNLARKYNSQIGLNLLDL